MDPPREGTGDCRLAVDLAAAAADSSAAARQEPGLTADDDAEADADMSMRVGGGNPEAPEYDPAGKRGCGVATGIWVTREGEGEGSGTPSVKAMAARHEETGVNEAVEVDKVGR